jgi:hypothetical protein
MGIQILPRVHPAQRGMGAGFHCLTGKAIATQQRLAILVNPPWLLTTHSVLFKCCCC